MTNRRKGSGVLSLIRSALAVCWLSGSLALESRAATSEEWTVPGTHALLGETIGENLRRIAATFGMDDGSDSA